MKIIHNGKQYDIGSLYETETGLGKLTGFNTEDECFEILNNGQYTYYSIIHEIKSELGTITDAPIELEEGCWYMTDDHKPVYWTGESWTLTGSEIVTRLFPETDFTPLYKMERAK